MMPGLSDVLRHAPGAEASRFGKDYVLLDPTGQMLRGLNETGAKVWELMDGHRTLQQISQAIAAAHQVAAERVTRDVLAFAGILLDKKLVERVSPPSPP